MVTFRKMRKRWWRRLFKHLLHRTCTFQVFITKLMFLNILGLLAKNGASYSWRILYFFFIAFLKSFFWNVFVSGLSDGGSQIHQADISQTGAHLKMSNAVSNTHCGNVSSTQIPTVCFDLGDEWDDFDDENLLHASKASLTLSEANAKLQHSEEKKIPGRET